MRKGKLVFQKGTAEFAELRDKSIAANRMLQELNHCDYADEERRVEIVKKLLGTTGENIQIEENFHCELGYNIHVGENFYAAYGCSIFDLAEVRIGDDCLLGPQCSIYTHGHSVDPKDRNKSFYGKPVTLGNNVWVGGNSLILAGVTIGDNSIVAAGSVVTRDVPINTIVIGSPARVLRTIY